MAYIDRKRTANDLMHRRARGASAAESDPPPLDLVVESLASIIVGGNELGLSVEVPRAEELPETPHPAEDQSETQGLAELPEAAQPAVCEATEPAEEPIEAEPNRITQLEEQQRRAAAALLDEQQAAESFLSDRPRFEEERALVTRLTAQIEADQLEAERLRQQRVAAEEHAVSEYAKAHAEVERLQIERLDLSANLEREAKQAAEAGASHAAQKTQLAETVERLQSEIETYRAQLASLREQSESSETAAVEALEGKRQKLVVKRDAVVAALQEQQRLAQAREEQVVANAPLQQELDDLRRQTAEGIAELKKLRKLSTAPLPSISELSEEIGTLTETLEKLTAHVEQAREEVGEREQQRRSAMELAAAREEEARGLREKIETARSEYESTARTIGRIEEEVAALLSAEELVAMKEEHRVVRQQLKKARLLLKKKQEAQATAGKQAEARLRKATQVARGIRIDQQETHGVLDKLLRRRKRATKQQDTSDR